MAGIPIIEPYRMPTAGELPVNIAAWRPDPARAVLLIHDMQRFFLAPVPEQGPRPELVDNVAALREHCAGHGMPIGYTAQPGGMTAQQRGLLADFWGPGMQVDPAERGVVEPLVPREGDWLFTKWRYSAFFRSDLLERMRTERRDQLVLCGVYAHVGLLATALEAFANDIQPFVVADAIADFSAADHRLALEYVARRCGMVVTLEEVFA